MNKQFFLLLALLLYGVLAAFGRQNRPGEVTVDFFVACNANGELDAKEGTKVTMEVTDSTGKKDTLSYTFPKGSHARAITKYFANALREKGYEVDGPKHDDANRKSKLTVKNVKRVRVGSSVEGKLHVFFYYPQGQPGPRTDGPLPRQPQPTRPPKPSQLPPHRGPTTLPKHGPGSIQILIVADDASGGQGGKTADTVTMSMSATQGANSVDIKLGFPKKTPATKIAKIFHDTLKARGFDLLPYDEGDSQVFFKRVTKLDGAYAQKNARTTFGWGETTIGILDKGEVLKHYSIGVHYNPSFVEMAAMNEYFDWINTTWSGNIAHINTLQGGRMEGAWMFNRHLGIGAGFRFLSGSASGTSVGGAFNTKVRTQGGYLRALGEWSPGAGRFSIGGECSVGYYDMRYKESEEQWSQSGWDGSPELRAALRLGYDLGEHVRLVAGAGYQWLQFDEFGINWLSPGQPPAVIDMSGVNVQTGLEFRF